MKLLNILFVLIFSSLLFSQNKTIDNLQGKIGRIVVLGSSTAAGHGPSCRDSSWVNRYRMYMQSQNPKIEVINLAVGGYTTYNILADGSDVPQNRPAPSIGHNITKALELTPMAIIINLPSNDCARKYTIKEQIVNYKKVFAKADSAHVSLWITTSQPCDYKEDVRNDLIAVKDSTYSIWGDHSIDFWTGIAKKDGHIIENYNSGDGTHLNDAAHKIFFKRVVEKNILR